MLGSFAMPQFPTAQEWARSLFEEAARHLQDARVLHLAQRYPASTASAMKAAELGLKSHLVLEGALGWWEGIHTTHTPWKTASTHPVLGPALRSLERHHPTLPVRIQDLELLAPSKPGSGKFQQQEEANPEYPFVSVDPTGGPASNQAIITCPSVYLMEGDSIEYYTTARDVLAAMLTLSPEIGAWSVSLPSAL